jgi:carboxyl-terminal processing protease
MSDRESRGRRVATGPAIGVLAVLALVLGVLLASGEAENARERDGAVSPQEYASIALEHMRDGIRADARRYDEVRGRVEREVENAKTAADTYSSLARAAEELGGSHTSFYNPARAAASIGDSETSTTDAGVVPTVRTVDGITTVVLPTFASPNSDARQVYVDRGARAIAEAAAVTTRGWVVDLRGNGGGDMWPMIAAVASLLDEGPVLSFEGRDGSQIVTMDGGAGALDGTVLAQSTVEGIETDLPVAVVIGPRTGSSGEAVAIAFIGQERVRVFGQPSYGFSSANEARTLPDGAVINLTVAVDTDRTGRRYGGPIQPDEFVEDQQLAVTLDAWFHRAD